MAHAELTEDQQALVVAYMPYVRALVARNWQQANSELQEDLVQQGYLGLVEAALRYDPVGHPTTTFIGYAKWRVRKYIGEYVHLDQQIRPPWAKIKGNVRATVKADVPLEIEGDQSSVLDTWVEDVDPYKQVEEEDYMKWFEQVWLATDPEVRELYSSWMQGVIEWDDVPEHTQEALFTLDTMLGDAL